MSYLSDYANNVSQILQHRGDAQAQAALNRGQVWGRAIGQIGDAIGGIPAARQLQKDNELKRADQAQQRELTGLQIAAAKRPGDDANALDTAWKAASTPDGKIDIDKLLSSTPGHLQTSTREMLTQYQKSLDDSARTKDERRKLDDDHRLAQQNAIGLLAYGVKVHGSDPGAFILAVSRALKDGLMDRDTAQQVITNLTPDKLPKALDQLIAQSPEATKLQDAHTKPTPAPQFANVMIDGKLTRGIWDESTQSFKPTNATPIPPAGDGQAKPYFTYQPVFDAQGRPISAIRFDARGGPPQVVDVAELTGGGQLKPPPGSLGADSINNEVSVDELNRLKDMFDKGAKDVIGPAEGRLRALGQNIPGVPVDKTFSDFSAATAAFRNRVIKAITGAAMGEPEAKRILLQVPGENDKPDVWISKYEQSIKNLGDLNARLRAKTTIPGLTVTVPQNVADALKGQPDGPYTLSDGSKWVVVNGVVKGGG